MSSLTGKEVSGLARIGARNSKSVTITVFGNHTTPPFSSAAAETDRDKHQKPVPVPCAHTTTGTHIAAVLCAAIYSTQHFRIRDVIVKMPCSLGQPSPLLSTLSTVIFAQLIAGDLVAVAESVTTREPQGSEPWFLSPEVESPIGLRRLRESTRTRGLSPLLYIIICIAAGLLFLFLFNFFALLARRKVTGKANFALFTMAVFASILLFLFTAFLPYGTSGHPSGLAGPGVSTETTTTTSHGPVFTVPPTVDIGMNVLPNVQDPQAVNPQHVCPGYTASHVRHTKAGFAADLTLAGPACNVYGNDIEDLALLVRFETDDQIHIQIQPRYIGKENETWFILPDALFPEPTERRPPHESNSHIVVSWENEPSFSFTVRRQETDDILFTTKGSVIVYEDQFIEFGSALPKNYNLYGLGEVIHGFRLGNNLTRTLFAADVGDVIDSNIYGNHPVYLDTRYFISGESGELTYIPEPTDKNAQYVSYTHGVFLRNAHAQEILLQPSNITWRALGGSIDLHFYNGPTAKDVMKSYQFSEIGLPAMQQYWTLGYHQCRWGYDNWTALQDVVDNFAKFDIPLETIWTDIDYMKEYRDFENDPVRFGYDKGAEFLSKLHANKQHYVPIVDSAIYAPNPGDSGDEYQPFTRGVDADAFVLNPDGSIYYGAVWPGYTVFPDWIGAVLNGSGAIDWWISEMLMWSKKVAFDGIWIDMSEVASFCVGSCGSSNLTFNPVHPPFELPGEPGNLVLDYPEGFNITNATEAASASSSLQSQVHASTATSTSPAGPTTSYFRTSPTPGSRNINWPPYAINNYHGDIAVHALSPNATHHGGAVEYDFHNIFGHQILNATYQALLEVFEGKRPFIIGRSTFAGSGKWAGHWGGDNMSLWAYMFFSIPQALSFSIFGIPMFGVDTCGFSGNSDAELCSRWMQLSAFFPFYRNHNTLGAISQEPYVWGSVITASKTAMHIRYQLLPYMYTLFAQANRDGTTVMRALAWEFPNEPWLANADRQFLLGGAIMVTPCLVQGATTVDGVFPGLGDGTLWYDWYDLTAVTGVQLGQNITIDAPLGHIPVYLRGGNVVPLQEPAMTTAASRSNPWGLLVVLDKAGYAFGDLYLDDGESLKPNATKWIRFSAKDGSLMITPNGQYVDTSPLQNVTVLGLPHAPSKVSLDGEDLDSSYWTYSEDKSLLALEKLGSRFPNGAWGDETWNITWS